MGSDEGKLWDGLAFEDKNNESSFARDKRKQEGGGGEKVSSTENVEEEGKMKSFAMFLFKIILLKQ